MPPHAIRHRLGVALDEARSGEDPQRPRYLALVSTQVGREAIHAPTAASDGIVRGQRIEKAESATQTARVLVRHRRTLAD